jgi:hypothetical protein
MDPPFKTFESKTSIVKCTVIIHFQQYYTLNKVPEKFFSLQNGVSYSTANFMDRPSKCVFPLLIVQFLMVSLVRM